MWYLDEDGEPKAYIGPLEEGHVRLHWEYDDYGNEVKEEYLDVYGKLISWGGIGPALCKRIYRDGNCEEVQYYDSEERLTSRGNAGYAIKKYQYDDYGQCILESYYDENKEITINTEQCCAEIEYKYDEKGNEVNIKYLGMEKNQ